jgi:hypothetical protein
LIRLHTHRLFKGISDSRVHQTRAEECLLPILTIIGLSFGGFWVLLTETVFARHGIGSFLIDSSPGRITGSAGMHFTISHVSRHQFDHGPALRIAGSQNKHE